MKKINIILIIILCSTLLFAGCNETKQDVSNNDVNNEVEKQQNSDDKNSENNDKKDDESTKDDAKENEDKDDTALLDNLLNKKWKLKDDENWKLVVEKDTIHMFIQDAGYDSKSKYTTKEVNNDEQYILVNITSTNEQSEDGTVDKEVNYVDKIIVNNDILTYVIKCGTEEESITTWMLEE